MEKKQIPCIPESFPSALEPLLRNAIVYDSSCSAEAKVYFIDRDGGYYLKCAPKGALQKEAALTRYFCGKGLAVEVLHYESKESDWLLTRSAAGEDCLASSYREDPKRLCDTTAQVLRMLHQCDFTGCPVPNLTADYLAAARHGFTAKKYDSALFPDNWGYSTPEEAWHELERNSCYLKSDTLLHGDYCLPNIILQDWRFSALIDLGCGGVGDRHIDLFWGIWSLGFNLKTHRYRDRFLDAYGRENVNEDIFRTVAAAEVFR